VADALAQVLARHQGRAFEPIEQAWLLSAAMTVGLSQRALATALVSFRQGCMNSEGWSDNVGAPRTG
jgi:hypothetical protein